VVREDDTLLMPGTDISFPLIWQKKPRFGDHLRVRLCASNSKVRDLRLQAENKS
jgi:hypothetical protein